MSRILRPATALGICLGIQSVAGACPFFWGRSYPPATDCYSPCPTPAVQVRAADPCAPASPFFANPQLPRPPAFNAQPTPAPPSTNLEPPLADPMPAAPSSLPRKPTKVTSAEPPLAEPEPSNALVKAANYPSPAPMDDRFFDAYFRKAAKGQKSPADRCVISFQNLTGREVVVTLDGKQQILAEGETWRVEPNRRFVWQMEGRPAQSESVSSNLAGLEIVLRR